ncbi:MAG TPA: DUF6282 family protein [Clostridium sp.]|uniref:DUF6282 family protein n=1 Tax=Clostridium sp. TaxID=1506 RepID=UPI002F937EC4
MENNILTGAYDLHVHSAPDVMPRKMNDLEMAQRIKDKGMKGYAIKSHYFCTSERATLIKKLYPEVNAIGAICLNNSVGGINPLAVEMAGRSGAKIVWMPTVDSKNELNFLKSGKVKKQPYWAKIKQEMEADGVISPAIDLLEKGELKESVYNVLKVIKKYDMILATSHIGWEEVRAVVKAAAEMNIKKIIITHPDFPSTFLQKEQQKELVNYGAFIEHCFTTPATEKVTWEIVYDQIKTIGSKHCILATDLGQPLGVYPDEGLEIFANKLMDNGFNITDIDNMIRTNPKFLVE